MFFCNAGEQHGQLSQFKVQAYKAARWHNPHVLQQEGQRYYIDVEGQRVRLSNTLEGWRFAFRCNCQQYHCRYCTFKTLQDEDDLFCQFCNHGTPAGPQQSSTHVPQCEIDAMQAWRQLRLDYAVACQVDLPFWHGRVDFYHMPTKLVVQIDGSSHFSGTHQVQPWDQLVRDLDCCAAAWKKGVRMLRIHHQHDDMQTPMLAAVRMEYNSYVMLTHHYQALSTRMVDKSISFVQWVADRLPDATCYYDIPSACYVFM